MFGLNVAACPGAGGIGLCRIGLFVGLRSWSPRTGEGGLGHVGRLIGLSLGLQNVYFENDSPANDDRACRSWPSSAGGCVSWRVRFWHSTEETTESVPAQEF